MGISTIKEYKQTIKVKVDRFDYLKVKTSFFFLRFYLFIRDTERKREREAEGETDSMQGAQCGT